MPVRWLAEKMQSWYRRNPYCRRNAAILVRNLTLSPKTMIDLRENGRPALRCDQYENHCRRIDSHAIRGNTTTLKLTCFEFWDDYRAKKKPRRDTVTVTALDQNSIRINGAAYIQCRK
jgi:hypothetical protein